MDFLFNIIGPLKNGWPESPMFYTQKKKGCMFKYQGKEGTVNGYIDLYNFVVSSPSALSAPSEDGRTRFVLRSALWRQKIEATLTIPVISPNVSADAFALLLYLHACTR